MKVLIVKTTSLGDVVHMLPAVSDAARACPGVIIDWAVEQPFAPLPRLHAAVNRTIEVAIRRWRAGPLSLGTWREIVAACRDLRFEQYDFIVDTQGLIKSSLIAYLAKGPRSGFDGASAKEPLCALLYHRKINVSKGQHAIDRSRLLLAQALGYTCALTCGPDYGIGSTQLDNDEGIPDQGTYVIGLHGTSRTHKEWPLDRWQALARIVAMQGLRLILPWGNESERLRAQDIATVSSNVVVLPRLDLVTLAFILRRSAAVVGVDTGLLHLAAAMRCAIVALYPATNPSLTGAMADIHSNRRIMNLSGPSELTVAVVSAALTSVLTRSI